jgi:hypothetical protein
MQTVERRLSEREEMPDLFRMIGVQFKKVKDVSQHFDGVREPTQRGRVKGPSLI